jgi:ribonuclease E
MAKKMLIDATHAEETRVVVVDGNKVEEFDFETVHRRPLQGNIYLAKVTRVEPSLQAAFVDYGGNRHGFLAFAEIHPDYYQIPTADRQALLEEERALARAEDDEENGRRRRPSPKPRPQAEAGPRDAQATRRISGMDVVDLGDEIGADALVDAPGEALPRDADAAADAAPEAEAEDMAEPYRAVDHASDTDEEIESVAEEDVAEEISAPRRPKPRRYKIQEVVKVRQIMLVQVVKEERGNKGAALTTYLSLAGRYCVLMPNTARGGGISRKITNAPDRKKLKEIAGEIEVPEGAGLIIRTAGAKRTKAEIVRDYEYLMRLWEQVRELTLRSIAPAPIYEEGNLIKRVIRDLYNREIDEVLVEGEVGWRAARDFMAMIMPGSQSAVKQYAEPMPLFARFQVESYLAGMFNPVVQLKSGGYIVIGVTEALVAIDVNSGRATKEGSIEDTALKTNLEAADEVARQLRLRDLAGLIVIDFIDMEERKNNAAVEKRLKDRLKTDRARIQVGRISGFGLLEMSRQRLRPGMLESTTQPCPHCHGTGLIRSDESMALTVLRALEEEGTRKRSREVLLRAPVGIVNFLFNQKREHIALIESRYGMAVRLEADPKMVSPDFAIEKFKTSSRPVPEAPTVVAGDASLMGAAVDEPVEAAEETDGVEAPAAAPAAAAPVAPAAEAGEGGKKKRRRRRRRRGPGNGAATGAVTAADALAEDDGDEDDGEDEDAPEAAPVVEPEAAPAAEPVADETPATKPARSRSRKPKAAPAEAPAVAAEAAPEPAAPAPAKPARGRSRKPKAEAAAEPSAVAEAVAAPAPEPAAEPALAPAVVAQPAAAEPPALQPDPGEEPVNAAGPVPDPALADPEPAAEARPKKRGWWSLGR